MSGKAVLSVRGLKTEFRMGDRIIEAVRGVSFDLYPGETLAVVGESGSGKTVTMLSILGLLKSPPAFVTEGTANFLGTDLLSMGESQLRSLRGNRIGVVFQDPMSALNPVLPVGEQIAESFRVHGTLGRSEARSRAIELLGLVGVPEPAARAKQYPHEMSGGMRQRVVIAMAVANNPDVIVADEPTTALDVTVQAQVVEVLKALQGKTGSAIALITHDLGLVAELADRVLVMYAGCVVECGSVDQVFNDPQHPYTLGLLTSLPRVDTLSDRLATIPGTPPDLGHLPEGCAFSPRCVLSGGRRECVNQRPMLTAGGDVGHLRACHFASEMPRLIDQVESDMGIAIRE